MDTEPAVPLLEVRDIHTAYDDTPVLRGISLKIGRGEVVTLLGRNGMGKTTTIRSIMGLTPPHKGEVVINGERVDRLPAERVARRGLGLVPAGRRVFRNLTVEENLVAASGNRLNLPDPWTLHKVFALFPQLQERREQAGGSLSGGEQQMLAIGRALMLNPLLLVLDEATEGLAPLVAMDIWRCIQGLKAKGLAVLLVDKNLAALRGLADRHVVLEKGRVVWSGDRAAFESSHAEVHGYLGL